MLELVTKTEGCSVRKKRSREGRQEGLHKREEEKVTVARTCTSTLKNPIDAHVHIIHARNSNEYSRSSYKTVVTTWRDVTPLCRAMLT